MFTDLICSLLPTLVVRKLQLPVRKKLGVCMLMAMGLAATAFAGLRAASLGGTNISDTTYTYTMTGVWMTIEANLGIIAANLATVRGVIGSIKKKLLGEPATTYDSRFHGTPMYAQYTSSGRRASERRGAENPQRTSEAGSDRSEIPLKGILQTTDVMVLDCEAHTPVKDIDEGQDQYRAWK